jgi:hypothetical protein
MSAKIWTRLGPGKWWDEDGIFWAWKIDGYYDIHHAPEGADPEGCDVISEFHPTLADARRWVREVQATDRLIGALS